MGSTSFLKKSGSGHGNSKILFSHTCNPTRKYVLSSTIAAELEENAWMNTLQLRSSFAIVRKDERGPTSKVCQASMRVFGFKIRTMSFNRHASSRKTLPTATFTCLISYDQNLANEILCRDHTHQMLRRYILDKFRFDSSLSTR